MTTRTAPIARGLRILAVSGLVLAAGCTPQYRSHGYFPPAEELSRINIGDSRDKVATIVGHPSATGMLQDDAWFYVGSRYRDYAWRAPVEIDREVLVISFDGDRVANIETYGLRDGRIVPLSRRVTESQTAGTPFLRQLFGNLGNFNPGGLLGE